MRDSFAPLTLGKVETRRTFSRFAVTESLHAPGQVLPRHAHRNHDLTIVCTGAFETGVSATSLECGPTDVLYLPAATPHTNRYAPRPVRSLIIEFSDEALEDGGRNERQACVLPSVLVYRSAHRISESYADSDPDATLAIESAVAELFAVVGARFETRCFRSKPNWLAAVCSFLRERLAEGVSLDDVARVAGVHPVHAARVFRAHHGCSVGDYVLRLKLEKALPLLRSTRLNVATIAGRCGFFDQSHFVRHFRRRMGVTPTQYRIATRP